MDGRMDREMCQLKYYFRYINAGKNRLKSFIFSHKIVNIPMYESHCSCMSEIQRFISKPARTKTKLLEKICGGSRSPPHLLGQIYLQASELDQTDKLFIHSFPFFFLLLPSRYQYDIL